jgi:hypothetical protein
MIATVLPTIVRVLVTVTAVLSAIGYVLPMIAAVLSTIGDVLPTIAAVLPTIAHILTPIAAIPISVVSAAVMLSVRPRPMAGCRLRSFRSSSLTMRLAETGRREPCQSRQRPYKNRELAHEASSFSYEHLYRRTSGE